MAKYEDIIRYHALCGMALDLLQNDLIDLQNYYRILSQLSSKYLGENTSLDSSAEGGSM